MQILLSLIVVLFLSIGAFFIYIKEHRDNVKSHEIPEVLKQVNLKFYSEDNSKNVWNIKGSILKVSGDFLYLKDIMAINNPYSINAKYGKLSRTNGVGYLKQDVIIKNVSNNNAIYTQYTNIDLKKSHFWANNNITLHTKNLSGQGSAFDIYLKPSLHVIVYNIKSYEK